ncbi:MAG TPA: response regulator [Alphaproteobacteria bacterium]|nr:response regulator [Alphaproteobacteria bacterium]
MAESPHVLIVDDSARMVALLKRWLERLNFRATGVTTIQEALVFLDSHATDWVITDVMLPTGDGMDILSYARARQPSAKVVVMTAFGSEATRQRALSLGAYAFLSKPFSSQALLAILTRSADAADSPRAAEPGDQLPPPADAASSTPPSQPPRKSTDHR